MTESTSKPPRPPGSKRLLGGGRNAPSPSAADKAVQDTNRWAEKFTDWAQEEMGRRTPDDETRFELLLTAPTGKVYALRVNIADPPGIDLILIRNP